MYSKDLKGIVCWNIDQARERGAAESRGLKKYNPEFYVELAELTVLKLRHLYTVGWTEVDTSSLDEL